MRPNPFPPQRHTEANAQRTNQRIDEYQLLNALLDTWELQPKDTQAREHEYILHLRQRVRQIKNYLLHRSQETI